MGSINIARHARLSRRSERGYVLLTLLLVMALLIIAAGTAATDIAFSIRREREEELIHRGVQYRRAIRAFTKKTGRFPVRLEELDNTDGMRFLRKHYKDPITGKDFKLVHMSDIQIYANPGAVVPNAGVDVDTGTNSGDPSNSTKTAGPPADSAGTPPDPSLTPGGQGQRGPASAAPLSASSLSASSPGQQQPIGGGLIVGVVSSSKKQSIREFDHKKHYNEWRFYYDTAFDQYYLRNAPTFRPSFQQAPQLGADNAGRLSPQPPQPGAPGLNPPQATQ
jgi:type II secretory pathway pseudopilin PulG